MDTIKIGEGQEFDRLGRVGGRLIAHLADPYGFGWMLAEDMNIIICDTLADGSEIEVALDEGAIIEIQEFEIQEFLQDDGAGDGEPPVWRCYHGDDEFNLFIEEMSRKKAHPYCCICKKCSEPDGYATS